MSGAFSVPFAAFAIFLEGYGQLIFIVLAFAAAGFAAYRVWSFERQKVCELETRLAAQLAPKFDFRLDEQHAFYQDDGYFYFVVGIQNLCKSTLKNVCVQFDRMVEGPTEFPMRRRLRLRDRDSYIFDLQPERTEYLIIARHKMWDPNARLEFMVEGGRKADSLALGTYKVKLKAYGDECRPVNRFFPIEAREDGGSFGDAFYKEECSA